MDDNCFQAAYGVSFLNHQFLVSAAAPVYHNAPSSLQPMLDANGQLALDKNGKIIQDGNITPIGAPFQSAPGQTVDQNCAVNTIYSANLTPVNSNPNSNDLLPSQNDSNPLDVHGEFERPGEDDWAVPVHWNVLGGLDLDRDPGAHGCHSQLV